MKRFNNVTSIKFNLNLDGSGCVNFDDKEQKWFLVANKLFGGESATNDNNCFSKKNFYKDEDGKVGFKHKVSSECLRHSIFESSMPYQNPTLQNIPEVMYAAIAHPDMILRGYTITRGKSENALRKKSVFSISDAEEIGPCRYSTSFDFHSRSGKKGTDNGSDTSIYKIENVGKLSYIAEGFINLSETQFISADLLYDRMAVDTNGGLHEKIYLSELKNNMVNFEPSFKYYYMNNSLTKDEWAERGILLNEESVDMLVKRLLRNILNISVNRRGAYLRATSLKLWVNTTDGDSTLVDITLDNIDDFFFGCHCKYNEADAELIKKNIALSEEYGLKQIEKKAKNTKKSNKNNDE